MVKADSGGLKIDIRKNIFKNSNHWCRARFYPTPALHQPYTDDYTTTFYYKYYYNIFCIKFH